jgi:hypothetical protein
VVGGRGGDIGAMRGGEGGSEGGPREPWEPPPALAHALGKLG